jgi:hypothetical protein
MFRIFQMGTASTSHLNRMMEELALFRSKAEKSTNVVSIFCTSDYFPDGSIVKFHPGKTLTNTEFVQTTSSEENEPLYASASSSGGSFSLNNSQTFALVKRSNEAGSK